MEPPDPQGRPDRQDIAERDEPVGGAQPRDESDPTWFSGPGHAHVLGSVRFTAHARDPDGAVTGYTWFFGDHRIGHGRLIKHKFGRPGKFRVVLRTSDRAGNWAFSSRTIVVRR